MAEVVGMLEIVEMLERAFSQVDTCAEMYSLLLVVYKTSDADLQRVTFKSSKTNLPSYALSPHSPQ